MSVLKDLKETKPLIDKTISKYFPREYKLNDLEYLLGKSNYQHSIKASNETIAKPIWGFLDSGGKRWRPALFLLIVEALNGDLKKAEELITIPEIVHNGTLIIDDIQDDSINRRGRPCLHKIYGNDLAINAGNAMYYMPLISLIKNRDDFDDKMIADIYETYVQEMINIHFGQGMDIYWHKETKNAENVTEDQYLQMCAYKTGTLARMSAKIAAMISNATEEQIQTLGRFGETIGIAFQIQDDILNISGDSEKFVGKDIGEDITEGKRTLILIHTLNKATKEDRERLEEILNKHTKEEKIIKEAIQIIEKYNSIEYAKNKAKELMEKSWNEIDEILKPSEAKEKLHAFAKFLIERDV